MPEKPSTLKEALSRLTQAGTASKPAQMSAPRESTVVEKLVELLTGQPAPQTIDFARQETRLAEQGGPGWEEGFNLLGAIPFPAGKVVYHGTSAPSIRRRINRLKGFEAEAPFFNRMFNRPSDTFGRLIHFAEDPMLANEFASDRSMSRVYPATLRAKHALDLTQPLPKEDVLAIARYLNERTYAPEYQGMFPKGTKRRPEEFIKELYRSMEGSNLTPLEQELLYTQGGFKPNVPDRYLNPRLSYIAENDKNFLKNLGFDAVRYEDVDPGNFAWAIEDPELARSSLSGGRPLGRPEPNAPRTIDDRKIRQYEKARIAHNKHILQVINRYVDKGWDQLSPLEQNVIAKTQYHQTDKFTTDLMNFKTKHDRQEKIAREFTHLMSDLHPKAFGAHARRRHQYRTPPPRDLFRARRDREVIQHLIDQIEAKP
jgi:hypothetical protein